MNPNQDLAPPLAAQLYSLREEAERDMGAVLERVAAIGYLGVEVLWLHGMPAKEFRSRLDDLDLELVGKHVILESEADLEAAVGELDEQLEIGNRTMLASFEEWQVESLDSTHRAIDLFNRLAEAVHERGMRLGYHNHWYEFSRRFGGETVMSILLERLDPRVFVEADVYWIQAGGADLRSTLEDFGSRLRLLHLKDGPCNTNDPMTAVGDGEVDVAAAVAAAPHVEWHVTELDRFDGDMFEAVEDSYRYLVGAGLSRGRDVEVAR